jgi:hypothetical protein
MALVCGVAEGFDLGGREFPEMGEDDDDDDDEGTAGGGSGAVICFGEAECASIIRLRG